MSKPAIEIEVQWPGKSLGEAQDYAEHFGCQAFKTKAKGYYRIVTEDPVNLYWLGANIHNEYMNQVEKSSISKFIEL